jgi:hypothetical protein
LSEEIFLSAVCAPWFFFPSEENRDSSNPAMASKGVQRTIPNAARAGGIPIQGILGRKNWSRSYASTEIMVRLSNSKYPDRLH